MWPLSKKKTDQVRVVPGDTETAAPASSVPMNPGGGAARFLPPEVLASISSLELLARTVVEGFIAGLHRSPFTGFSTEFAEYRQYMPGDDLRHLDWKLLGRTDRYFIKKYRADTNSQCHILIDASKSMSYSTGPVTKLEYAKFLAASLAYLTSQQQDAVGMITFDQGVRLHIPAQNRTGHLRTILGNLEQLTAVQETRLAQVLHEVAERITRRGIIILISDLYDDPEEVVSALEHLRFKGNDVIVFHVMDRNEIDFNFNEPVLLRDLETDEMIHILPDVIAEGYRDTVKKHFDRVREGSSKNRIDYEFLTTDKPLDFALFSFLAKRAMR